MDPDLLSAAQGALASVLGTAGVASDEEGLVLATSSGATVTVIGRSLAAGEVSQVADAVADDAVADVEAFEGATVAQRGGSGFEQVIVVTDTHYFTVVAAAAPPASPGSPLPLSTDELRRLAGDIARAL